MSKWVKCPGCGRIRSLADMDGRFCIYKPCRDRLINDPLAKVLKELRQ